MHDPTLYAALHQELARLQVADEFGCTPLGVDGRLVMLDGNLDQSHAVYVATDLLSALQACPEWLTYAAFWQALRPWTVTWVDTIRA